METISIGTTVLKKKVRGKLYFYPAYILAGETHLISTQGNVVRFETEKEAEDYTLENNINYD